MAAERGTTPSSSSSTLNHYAHEEPLPPSSRVGSSPACWVDSVSSTKSSTSRRSAARVARFPDNADIQARLVTGASNRIEQCAGLRPPCTRNKCSGSSRP